MRGSAGCSHSILEGPAEQCQCVMISTVEHTTIDGAIKEKDASKALNYMLNI
jgi:hypothetical protein